MGKAILFLLIIITAATTLARPWIGITAYYLLALLGPQYIWFWDFEGLRASFLVATITMSALSIKLFTGGFDLDFIKTHQNLLMLLLWFFVAMSYFFGAFASVDNTYYDSQELILRASKIFLFYFCATLTINDAKKLKYFSTVLVITTVYLIYWANLQYFIENWGQFNSGRLMGPKTGGSIYGDENAFGMIFVAGLPFVYYLGFMADRRWLRYALWGTIPFGLHALFLTGSRGALLGLGVAVAIIIFQSRRKYFALFLIPLMIYFFQWQGGSVMKERSGTIASFEGESSAESRIDAWRAGAKMIADHPVAGVGIGHFMMAIPYYSESQPRIAHNTLVQYTAESGLGAGLCYLIIAYTVITSYLKINMWCKEQDKSEYVQHLYCINNATTTSFIGLFVCSMFLTLNYYEIYYYLLVINSALSQLCKSLSYKNSDMAKLIHNSI